MDIRKQKGIAIATKATIKREGKLYLVPSQSGRGKYKVDADASNCTCPDFDFRQAKCKHIYAVEHVIEKTKTTVIQDGKTTVTETVKVTRKTYPQVWPAYNAAQTNEKRLSSICSINSVRVSARLHSMAQGAGSYLSKI